MLCHVELYFHDLRLQIIHMTKPLRRAGLYSHDIILQRNRGNKDKID